VHDRGGDDAGLGRRGQVDGAVVYQHVDLELDAARHLVVGAVQVVIGHRYPLEPALGRLAGGDGAVARHVDPVALGVPAPDHVDRVRIRLRVDDVLLGVGLLDRRDEVGALQLAGAPVALLVVGQLDPEAPPHDRVEQVPVVVQRGVDVQGYSGHARATVDADAAPRRPLLHA
jgi:hypothetical protein